jgi:hypothetical protein
MASLPPFSTSQFILRWLSSAFIVFLTYNPFQYSYWHWITAPGWDEMLLKTVATVLLLIIYVFMIWVILASLGLWGLAMAVAIGVLATLEVLDLLPDALLNNALVEVVYLFCLATFFAVGLAWPHMTSRLSGQIQKRYLIKTKYFRV